MTLDRRIQATRTTAQAGSRWTEQELDAVEREHPEGLSVQQIVGLFGARGERLTEATFRKYVQLGLLPRSVRVGRKGKHRGSQGLYPTTVVRQLDLIRRLMAQGFTIDEIQRDFLFIRGDIEELSRRLSSVFSEIEKAIYEGSAHGGTDEVVSRSFREVRTLSDELLRKLGEIEQRLAMRARMARAVV